ncbi:MAG: hypothetical protein FJX72_18110, partial [Armatimonadetes bacterium]|nr:hypothetical protein [Armatimonadota bacterium]
MSSRPALRADSDQTVAAGMTWREMAALAVAHACTAGEEQKPMDDTLYVKAEELDLRALQLPGRRALSFARRKSSPETWRTACRRKLAELLAYAPPKPATARLLRQVERDGVRIEAYVMAVAQGVHLPAYLLRPASGRADGSAVMAIHGHGEAEPCIGSRDDYHHMFALRIARSGRLVLCPEHR